MNEARLRVAVIGVGAMGRHHVRLYRELPSVELTAVCDVDQPLARQVAGIYGLRSYASHVELLNRERPDAVSVAAPTAMHHSIVSDALAAGCNVLVEKPIAATLEEAQALSDAADRANRLLMVGHVERYNPAVLELAQRLAEHELGRVFQIHARRLGPFPARVRDVGVVIDLATHDLDIMRLLTRSEALRVYAETRQAVHTSGEDLLNGIVRFANSALGLLEINWLTPTKIRELYVTGERGMFRVDYLTQDLFFFENAEAGAPEWDALSMLRGVSEGTMTRFALRKVEPLRAELEAFVAAVRGGQSPIVTARDGIAALRLGLALIHSAELGAPVALSGT